MPKIVDHDARRADFARAAFEIIAEHGVESATFRSVAKKAGYTTGALVYYIKEKDDLLLNAAVYSAELVRARMVAFEQKLTGLEALRFVLYEALPLDKKLKGHWKIWIGFWDRSLKNPRVHQLTTERYTEWRLRITNLLEGAKEANELPDSLDIEKTADSLVALVDGIGVQVLLTGNKISKKRQLALVDHWVDLIASGVSIYKPTVSREADSPVAG